MKRQKHLIFFVMIPTSKMKKEIFNGQIFSNIYSTKVKYSIKFFRKIKNTLLTGDRQGLHVRSNHQISMRALGGIIWYLQHCFVDKELLSMRKFVFFQPPDENIELKEASTFKQQNMVK
jgi:hypothetical protein